MKLIKGYWWVLPALCGLILFFDVISIMPRYEMQKATVRKVIPDTEWGYIGTDWVTLVIWGDNSRSRIGGDLGEPDERIMAPRCVGRKSVFNIFGDE